MRKIVLCLDGIPPSNNEFLGQNKTRWKYNRYKKEWEDKIRLALILEGIYETPFEHALVHLHYIFPDRRRRDPDNYSGKMLLDPLTRFGVLTDDSFNNIELKISAETKKGERMTVIEVIEVEELNSVTYEGGFSEGSN